MQPRPGRVRGELPRDVPGIPDPALLWTQLGEGDTYPRRQRSQTTPRLPLLTVYAKGSERKSSSPGRSGANARSPFPLSVVLNFSTFDGSILAETGHLRRLPGLAARVSWATGRGPAPAHTYARGAGRARAASEHAQMGSLPGGPGRPGRGGVSCHLCSPDRAFLGRRCRERRFFSPANIFL